MAARMMPWYASVAVRLGGLAQFLFGLILILLLFMIGFGSVGDYTPVLAAFGGTGTATGTVLRHEDSGISIGGDDSPVEKVWRVVYRYTVDGRTVEGACHTRATPPVAGSSVMVTYARIRPAVSHIDGATPVFPSWVFGLMWGGLLVLGVGLWRVLRGQFRQERLLRTGQFTIGTLVHVERLSADNSEGAPTYRFAFAFMGGQAVCATSTPKEAWKPYLPSRYTPAEVATVSTMPLVGKRLLEAIASEAWREPEPLGGPDAPTETVLYDPRDPSSAIVLAVEMPNLQVDAFSVSGIARETGFAVLLLPGACLLGLGRAVLQAFGW